MIAPWQGLVQLLSCFRIFATPQTAACRIPRPSPTPEACSNSCPSSRWCHPTISCSIICFSCLQSCPASESFQMSQLFTTSGQSTETSASASAVPVNIQGWFPLGLTGWISFQSKGLSSTFNLGLPQHLNLKASILQCSAFFYGPVHTYTWLLEK